MAPTLVAAVRASGLGVIQLNPAVCFMSTLDVLQRDLDLPDKVVDLSISTFW